MPRKNNCLVSFIYFILYQLTCFFLTVNLVAIVILSRGKCGLSRCITRYMLSMSAADLLVIISEVILTRLNYLYFPICFLDLTPVCSLGTSLLCATTDCSVWLTVAFTVDRHIAICCQKLKMKYCTERTAAVVIGTICALSCFRNIPWYFMYQPWYVIDNVPWFCKTKESYYGSRVWDVYYCSYTLLTPCVSFVLILLLNSLTVRYILSANRIRRRLVGHNSTENNNNLEMVNRKKSIVILFAISWSFILLWMNYVVYYVYRKILNYHSYSGYSDPVYVLYETGCMLELLCSCTNTCIYAVTQSKFSEELKKAAKYPLRLMRHGLCESVHSIWFLSLGWPALIVSVNSIPSHLGYMRSQSPAG
uniref:G-protein coupled receptors family 1 profile domain-containing protein n=1 Tax=Callorhinchus milii TaxID=7868 RepID=A0A4W3GQY0_CALMI